MKPTGNRSVATWLWRPACCLLQCCIRESKRDFSELLAPASVCRVTECATQARRNIKPYGKRGDFFLIIYLLQHYLFVILACLLPGFYLFTVHTNTMVELVFLENRRLQRILIKRSQDATSIHAHTRKNTHPHGIRHTIFHIRNHKQDAHTRFPRQTHQLYYIVSVRARGRGKLEGTAAACTIQLNLRIRQVFELAATGATQKTQLQLLSHFFSPPRYLRVRKRKIQLCRVADLNILFNWLKLEKQQWLFYEWNTHKHQISG